jgi:hypothetical protein
MPYGRSSTLNNNNTRRELEEMVTQLRKKIPAVIVALALTLGTVGPAGAQAKKVAPFNVVPIMITNVIVAGDQLVAQGLVGTTPFEAPIALTPGAISANATCPVLNLSLGPIQLSLLGLNVNTSGVCLQITAIQGGGLLGDLLCSIANLLNGGLALSEILATLTPQQLSILDSGLTQVLNQAVFIPLSRSDALAAASCSILHLELGPIDLNLLGLRVELNDCSAGPVVLDLTATPGGGLLGDLLCSLSGLLNGNATQKILEVLQNIAVLLGGLLG